MFGKSVEEIQSDPDGVMGANHVELADDMLTIQSQPIHVMPSRVKEPPLKSILSLRKLNPEAQEHLLFHLFLYQGP